MRLRLVVTLRRLLQSRDELLFLPLHPHHSLIPSRHFFARPYHYVAYQNGPVEAHKQGRYRCWLVVTVARGHFCHL